MANYGNTPRFIPRRDIFVGNKNDIAEEKSYTTITSNTVPPDKNTNAIQKRKPLPQPQHQIQPLLIFILIWLIIPNLRNQSKKGSKRFTLDFAENLSSTETIANILSDISPYLGQQEQQSIQTVIGIFEAVNILNSIRAGTYQNPRIMKTTNIPMNSQERMLGMIKALKPYLPSSNHDIIDKTIHTYNAINKVSENLVRYTAQSNENIDKQKPIDKITEILEIINPLIPTEQRQRLDQVQNMIKMYNAMESSQLWEKWTREGANKTKAQSASSSKESSREESSNKESGGKDVNNKARNNKDVNNKARNNKDTNNKDIDSNNKKSDSTSKETKSDAADTLKSLLNPEQAQAMEIMMKMAQLLSQKSNDKEDE